MRALLSGGVARDNSAYLPWGDEKNVVPPVGAQNVSRVAATLLACPNVPPYNVYSMVSETRSVGEIVETLGKAIGRPVRYVAITDEQWTDAVKQWLNPHALDHLTSMWRYIRKNERRLQVTDTIRTVTGRKPQTLEEFFRANKESVLAGKS